MPSLSASPSSGTGTILPSSRANVPSVLASVLLLVSLGLWLDLGHLLGGVDGTEGDRLLVLLAASALLASGGFSSIVSGLLVTEAVIRSAAAAGFPKDAVLASECSIPDRDEVW